MPGYTHGATAETPTYATEIRRLRSELRKAQESYDALAQKIEQAKNINQKISAALTKKSEECAALTEQNTALNRENKRLAVKVEKSVKASVQTQKIEERDKLIEKQAQQIEELKATPAPVAETVFFEGYLSPGALDRIKELVA